MICFASRSSLKRRLTQIEGPRYHIAFAMSVPFFVLIYGPMDLWYCTDRRRRVNNLEWVEHQVSCKMCDASEQKDLFPIPILIFISLWSTRKQTPRVRLRLPHYIVGRKVQKRRSWEGLREMQERHIKAWQHGKWGMVVGFLWAEFEAPEGGNGDQVSRPPPERCTIRSSSQNEIVSKVPKFDTKSVTVLFWRSFSKQTKNQKRHLSQSTFCSSVLTGRRRSAAPTADKATSDLVASARGRGEERVTGAETRRDISISHKNVQYPPPPLPFSPVVWGKENWWEPREERLYWIPRQKR